MFPFAQWTKGTTSVNHKAGRRALVAFFWQNASGGRSKGEVGMPLPHIDDVAVCDETHPSWRGILGLGMADLTLQQLTLSRTTSSTRQLNSLALRPCASCSHSWSMFLNRFIWKGERESEKLEQLAGGNLDWVEVQIEQFRPLFWVWRPHRVREMVGGIVLWGQALEKNIPEGQTKTLTLTTKPITYG